jgi:hypothetical protein
MSGDLSPAPGTPQTGTKAKVAAFLTTLGAVLTFIVAYFPDNDNLQLWGGLALGVLTIAATSYGVYNTPNQPTA